MVVPFGVGVGDFLQGIGALYNVFKSLSQSKGSAREYLDAIKIIRSLENALLQVRELHKHVHSHEQRLALEQEVASCEATVDVFLAKMSRYHGHLSVIGTTSTWKDRVVKIRWHIVESDRVAMFMHQLSQHTSALGVILLSIQISATNVHQRSHEEMSDQVENISRKVSRVEQNTLQVHPSLASINAAIDDQNKEITGLRGLLLTSNALTETNNAQQAELLRTMKRVQNSLPAQVLMQQPFIFTDAMNRRFPIHLEWIDSWEAFLAVLKIKFKDIGQRKIESREFVLTCARLNRDIEWGQSWQSSFQPGREYGMSMLFRKTEKDTTLCVSCKARCAGDPDTNIECHNCGTTFRRIMQIDHEALANSDIAMSQLPNPSTSTPEQRNSATQISNPVSDTRDHEVIEMFSRVRVLSRILLTNESLQSMGCWPRWEDDTVRPAGLISVARNGFDHVLWSVTMDTGNLISLVPRSVFEKIDATWVRGYTEEKALTVDGNMEINLREKVVIKFALLSCPNVWFSEEFRVVDGLAIDHAILCRRFIFRYGFGVEGPSLDESFCHATEQTE